MVKRKRFWILALAIAAAVLLPDPAAAGRKKEMHFAVSLARRGLWNEAAHRFRLLVEKDPDDARLWNNLAVAYEAAQRFDKAREAYEKAASLLGKRSNEFKANHEAFLAFYEVWTQQENVTPGEKGPDLAAGKPEDAG